MSSGCCNVMEKVYVQHFILIQCLLSEYDEAALYNVDLPLLASHAVVGHQVGVVRHAKVV